MADDLKAVTRKIMDTSIGQGHDHYQVVGYASHLDYEKWNNHQRRTSTDPVFEVTIKFFILPKLFCRTHEFFEQVSFIMEKDRI